MPQLDPHPRAALSWKNGLSLLKQWVCLGCHDAQDSNPTQDYRFHSRERETIFPSSIRVVELAWVLKVPTITTMGLRKLPVPPFSLSRDNVCTIIQLFEMNKWVKCSKMSNHHHWLIWEASDILYHVNLLKLYIMLQIPLDFLVYCVEECIKKWI